MSENYSAEIFRQTGETFRSIRLSVDPDGQMPAANHDQLEITLLAGAKGSTGGIDYFANAHFFRPEAFTIDHRGVLLEATGSEGASERKPPSPPADNGQ